MHSTAWRNAVRRSMLVVGLAGGFTVLGAGIAASTATAEELAPPTDVVVAEQPTGDDDNDETSGEDGTVSGNQVEADVEAPVDASDNQVTVIGDGNQHEGGTSELQNGVLQVVFDEPSPAKFVVSPNAPVRQVWVSAMSRSYKLSWVPQTSAFELDGEPLDALIQRLVREFLS